MERCPKVEFFDKLESVLGGVEPDCCREVTMQKESRE